MWEVIGPGFAPRQNMSDRDYNWWLRLAIISMALLAATCVTVYFVGRMIGEQVPGAVRPDPDLLKKAKLDER